MFFEELSPLLKEMTQNPVAFLGGFAAGILRLDLNQEPVKSWLEKQGAGVPPGGSGGSGSGGSSSSGPQSISID
ncbi:MAG: hypothetical protein HC771_14665 [Synechococcales cyanobacterium CRU_2_2]|nr:hypothetical protein [Synechococcales cyanobacterium CRU_2_2]